MAKIKILDTLTTNKIAAGEIIERPVSVIKELLENSLDAQANYIEIEIEQGGLGLIRVLDNGIGMSREDLKIACQRHATSKITGAQDLENISTFGFRGEALSSITAVSQLILTTCERGSEVGNQIKLIGGRIDNISKLAFNPGTSVEVRNLFFNVPARRKFVKSLSYEAGLITELVTKYSLGHPDIRFKLINSNNIVYDTAGLNSVEDRLRDIYGQEMGSSFIFIDKEIFPGLGIKAWLAPETFNRNTRNQQTIFINGRLVKSMAISKSIENAYHTLLPKGRFPIAIVSLTIPFNEVDVNIHPTKLNIKIYDIEKITEQLTKILKDKIWQKDIVPNLQTDYIGQLKPLFNNNVEEQFFLEPEPFYNQEKINFSVPKYEEIVQEKAVSERDDLNLSEISSLTSKGEQQADKKTISIRDIPDLEPIGQLNNTFILAQNKNGLYIIDQHTCHERILYEKLMKKENQKDIATENLLIPISLNLTGKQEGILIKNILLLNSLGFIVENFGLRTFVLRGVPVGLDIINKEQFFIDLIDTLEENEKLTPAKIKESLLTLASCKAAVKANHKLTREEIYFLLQQLTKVDNPHTCPHGRPIIHHLSMSKLYKIFQRGEFIG